MGAIRPIKRTLKCNLRQPEIFAFSFDVDTADGYSETPGYVVVARGSADGVYNCTLPRKYANAQIVFSKCNVSAGAGAAWADITSPTPVDGVIEITTYSTGTTVAQLSGKVVQVLMLLQGS